MYKSVLTGREKEIFTLLTKGFNAIARKIEIPIIIKPARAWYKIVITSMITNGTIQNFTKVLVSVSISLDIHLLHRLILSYLV